MYCVGWFLPSIISIHWGGPPSDKTGCWVLVSPFLNSLGGHSSCVKKLSILGGWYNLVYLDPAKYIKTCKSMYINVLKLWDKTPVLRVPRGSRSPLIGVWASPPPRWRAFRHHGSLEGLQAAFMVQVCLAMPQEVLEMMAFGQRDFQI
jgi:hypothetical protein